MTFSELLGAVVQTATRNVSAGSRRNALSALEARYRAALDSREVLASLATGADSPIIVSSGPSGSDAEVLTIKAG